jgi:hypothetical protein
VSRLCYLTLVAVTLAGCGRSAAYVPVTGTVKYSDGSVPTGDVATVTFQPAESGPNSKGASGTINKDGTFTLQSVQPNDGARPGDYQVTVHVMQGYPRGRSLVAETFTKPDTTPLKATVEDSGENRFDFIVERP